MKKDIYSPKLVVTLLQVFPNLFPCVMKRCFSSSATVKMASADVDPFVVKIDGFVESASCGKRISCIPDREILHFTPCEKFLSHPRYLTPVAPCVQVFFFNTGCIGRHVISSLSAHVTMTSKRLKSKWRTPRFDHFSR